MNAMNERKKRSTNATDVANSTAVLIIL